MGLALRLTPSLFFSLWPLSVKPPHFELCGPVSLQQSKQRKANAGQPQHQMVVAGRLSQ